MTWVKTDALFYHAAAAIAADASFAFFWREFLLGLAGLR